MQETDGARPAPDPLAEVIAGYPDDVRAMFGARTVPLGRLPATADRDLDGEIASLDGEIASLRRAVELAARMREAEDHRHNREDSTNELCGEAARTARLDAFKAGRAFKTGTQQAERREFARRLFGIQRDGAAFDFVGGIA